MSKGCIYKLRPVSTEIFQHAQHSHPKTPLETASHDEPETDLKSADSCADVNLTQSQDTLAVDMQAYLYPFLTNGPCNNLMELNQFLVIAAITNRTLIIPRMLYVHHEGNEEDWSTGAAMQQVLDWSLLTTNYSVISYDDYTAEHGSISISSVYSFFCTTGGCHFASEEKWWMRRYIGEADFTQAHYVEIPMDNGVPLCSTADQIQQLADAMGAGEPVVGACGVPFGLTSDNDNFGCGALDPTSVCCSTMSDVYANMRNSELVRGWADEFISATFLNSSFLGIHVRPYEDNCLTVWAENPMFADEDVSWCATPTLQTSMLNATATAMQALNIQNIFVASHPSIRAPNIIPRMRSIGVLPVFVGFEFIAEKIRQSGVFALHDFTENEGDSDQSRQKLDSAIVVFYLLLVEQEIMERGDVFIGSKHSSISGIVRNVRAARAHDVHDSLIS